MTREDLIEVIIVEAVSRRSSKEIIKQRWGTRKAHHNARWDQILKDTTLGRGIEDNMDARYAKQYPLPLSVGSALNYAGHRVVSRAKAGKRNISRRTWKKASSRERYTQREKTNKFMRRVLAHGDTSEKVRGMATAYLGTGKRRVRGLSLKDVSDKALAN